MEKKTLYSCLLHLELKSMLLQCIMSLLLQSCSNIYSCLLQHQFIKWRNIVILKLQLKFHVFHQTKMVIEFSVCIYIYIYFLIFFLFPPSLWPYLALEIFGKHSYKKKGYPLVYIVISYILVDGDHDRYHIEGLMESPAVDDDRDCFSPLLINATSVNIEVYYNKAVNYTLMVTFVSFNYHYSPSLFRMLLACFAWTP